MGVAGFNFLNILPKLGATVAKFFGELFTDVFNSIYNQQIDQKSARKVIVGFFAVVGVTTAIIVGFNSYKNFDFSIEKKEIKETKKKVEKQEKKPAIKVEKNEKKT